MIRKLITRTHFPRHSYSQSGEDIIVVRSLSKMHIRKPTYLDIGASDPVELNNTYLLYKMGCTGVLVEPNPMLARKIKSKRKKDKFIQAGLATNSAEKADFYVMSNQFLSTFDKYIAEQLASEDDLFIEGVVELPLLSINDVIKDYSLSCPDFVSLDLEGADLEVLKTLDFDSYRPVVFCLETISYSRNKVEHKRTDIISFMQSHGYLAFADTYINTIFVDEKKWRNR